MKAQRTRMRRSAWLEGSTLEGLEGRLVLSSFGALGLGGTGLAASLSSVGVETALAPAGGLDHGAGFGWGDAQAAGSSQLQKDIQALETEYQTLAAGSGVTVADLAKLSTDDQAIAKAGLRLDGQASQKVTGELAAAVAGGAAITQSQTDFVALFADTSVSQVDIDKAFTDLVQTIGDSKVTSADLQAVATDQQAIQTDLGSQPAGQDAGFGLKGMPGAVGLGPFGTTLTASLSNLGVVTMSANDGGHQVDSGLGFGPGFGGGLERGFGRAFAQGHGLAFGGDMGQTAQPSQLAIDQMALHTEVQTIAGSSGVTAADLTNLGSDSRAIATSGVKLDGQGLAKVTSELATAVAGGGDTTQAKTDFNALFANSSTSSTITDKAFNDMIVAIQHSNITGADLQSISADQQAVQNDIGNAGGGATDSGSASSAATTTTGGSATTSTTGSTTATGSAQSTTPTTATTLSAAKLSRFAARHSHHVARRHARL
jgi:hypothetical protein